MIKDRKAQASLGLFLALIVTLFLVGLIIMIFSIMGTELRDSSYTETTGSVVNETRPMNTTAIALSVAGLRNVVCSITSAVNESGASILITSGNYTVVQPCAVKNLTTTFGYPNDINWTYTYTYDADNTATAVMNDTITSLATGIDFFDLFIIIGAMVVLISLVVLIVISIRGSALMGQTKTSNDVGTA